MYRRCLTPINAHKRESLRSSYFRRNSRTLRTDAQVELLSDIHCVADVDIGLGQSIAGPTNGVLGDLREPSPEHLNVRLDWKWKQDKCEGKWQRSRKTFQSATGVVVKNMEVSVIPFSRAANWTDTCFTDIDDLEANVFPFPIAVCPDDKCLHLTSFSLQCPLSLKQQRKS